MARFKTFPQLIFVKIQQDRDEDYMVADLTKADSLGDEDRIVSGLYQFVRAEELRKAPVLSVKKRNRKTS